MTEQSHETRNATWKYDIDDEHKSSSRDLLTKQLHKLIKLFSFNIINKSKIIWLTCQTNNGLFQQNSFIIIIMPGILQQSELKSFITKKKSNLFENIIKLFWKGHAKKASIHQSSSLILESRKIGFHGDHRTTSTNTYLYSMIPANWSPFS